MPTLAETLLWLCRIPSPIGEEAELCDRIAERLANAGLGAPVRRYDNSLVVPLRRGSGGPHVALAGHLDVVRTVHDAPARIEGERLYGPGAADMKSGLVLMLDLAETGELPAVDLTLVFYAREEGPFDENELGPVLASDPELRHADIAVALEPSDNKLQLGCGGSVHAAVRFRGRTAHSARPWQGDNAIHKAGRLLVRLGALEPERSEVDGLEWTRVTSATLAHGGRARNIVPDLFELNVNHRFGPIAHSSRPRSTSSSSSAATPRWSSSICRRPRRRFEITRWWRRWRRAASWPWSPSRRGQTLRVFRRWVLPPSTSDPACRRRRINRTSGRCFRRWRSGATSCGAG